MTESRDSVMASALRLMIVVGCVAAVAILAAGPGGTLGGQPAAGRGLVPSNIDATNLAAVLLVSAGIASVVTRCARAVGWLAIALGFAWIVASASATSIVPPLLRPIAAGAPTLLVVLLCAVALAADEGRAPGALRRVVVALMVSGAVVAVLRIASYSGFFDVAACPAACERTDPILDLAPSVRLELARAARVVALGCGVGAILIGGWSSRPRSVGSASRRLTRLGIVLAAAGLGGSAALELAGRQPRASAGSEVGAVALAAALEIAGIAAIAVGLWWSVARLARLRARIRRLAADIAASPGETTVEHGLARALGDPSVAIGYVAEDGASYVARDGEPFDIRRAAPGESTTTIERSGRPLAVIRHRGSIDEVVVRAELTTPMIVAIDNERLRALALAALRALRQARTDIVAIEDAERRKLERNLHDGAQQQILAIAFDLRLARTESQRAGDPTTPDVLERVEALALSALDDLRHVARGVHPAILDQGGLAPALSSLAEDAPIAITLEMDRSLRLAPLIEATAYQVVAEGVSDAAGAGATEVAITVARSDTALTLDLEFDGRPPEAWPIRIADRVGAAGGDVSISVSGGDRTTLRAVMPCG